MDFPAVKTFCSGYAADIHDLAAANVQSGNLRHIPAGKDKIPDMEVLCHTPPANTLWNHRHVPLDAPAKYNLGGRLAAFRINFNQKPVVEDVFPAFRQRPPRLGLDSETFHSPDCRSLLAERMDFRPIDHGYSLMVETEIRQTIRFKTAAQYGTLSKAAEALNTSQPVLSRTMRRLEEELQVSLFDRQKNKLTLTQSGDVAVACAQKVLEEVRRMVEQVRAVQGGTTEKKPSEHP